MEVVGGPGKDEVCRCMESTGVLDVAGGGRRPCSQHSLNAASQ